MNARVRQHQHMIWRLSEENAIDVFFYLIFGTTEQHYETVLLVTRVCILLSIITLSYFTVLFAFAKSCHQISVRPGTLQRMWCYVANAASIQR